MKQILLTLLLFIAIGQNCPATEWGTYFVYIQTDYPQGPWIRTSILDKSGSYTYLYPKKHEDLFGSEGKDLAIAIFNHLKKDTEHPESYNFQYTLSLVADTVVIQTKIITDLEAIKNELIASFTLNSFKAIKIIEQGKTIIYQLKDISIPYMDLVFHPEAIGKKRP